MFVNYYICFWQRCELLSTLMKRLIAILGVFAMLTGAFFLSTSCEKDTRDYQLTVVITAHDSVKVQNALVHLYAPVANTIVDYYFYTNEQGEVSATFENKVVLEIEAAKGSFKECAFAEVERGENIIYVDIKPFGVHNGC